MRYIVHPLPAFHDNYIWCIEQTDNTRVVVVDPGDAGVVSHWLQQHNKQLEAIVVTHKHPDHIGGVHSLVQQTGAQVYAPNPLQLQANQVSLKDGDNIQIFDTRWQVLAIPGHTMEHIMYYCAELCMAFVGDTLFAAGCGRMFEGTAQQMYTSLQTIMSLPDDTQVYPAHEYTLGNLRFAARYDPENHKLQQRLEDVEQLRELGQPSLPTNIQLERETNPFCRVQVLRPMAEKMTGNTLEHDWQVFAYLRKEKDNA